MTPVKFISGIQKTIFDIKLIIRILFALFKYFGFFSAFKELKKYSKDKRSSFAYLSNRYIRQGRNYFAIADLPPLNSKEFINYFINEINVINHSEKQNLNFAIVCISARCPYSCKYCYNSHTHQKKEIISTEILIKTIKQLQKHGVQNIYLSGGEPMMRWTVLQEILTSCNNKNTGFWLLTTGWQLNIEKFVQLKKLGLRGVAVSFDSTDKTVINTIKAKENAFDNAVNAIKNANQVGLLVAIDCVIGKKLLQKENFIKYLEFIQNLGANFVNCYSPRLKDMSSEYFVKFQLKDYRNFAEITQEIRQNKKYKNYPIPYSPDIWEATRGCVGGRNFIYIDPSGEVKPCPFIKASFGNILKTDIANILKSKENMLDFKICKTNKMLSENLL